jgi:hypothetical protein
MKVMIAYDGSKFADAAVDDLLHTGLPRDSEVLAKESERIYELATRLLKKRNLPDDEEENDEIAAAVEE